MSELKPCRCGGTAKLWTSPTGDFIRCDICGLTISYLDGFDDALLIEEWNRRAEPENNPLTLEEMRQMDGEPVYTTAIGPGCFTGWEIAAGFGIGPGGEKTIRLCNTADGLYDTDEDLYGKTWLAYRQNPVSK
jgi:hypothetical protein